MYTDGVSEGRARWRLLRRRQAFRPSGPDVRLGGRHRRGHCSRTFSSSRRASLATTSPSSRCGFHQRPTESAHAGWPALPGRPGGGWLSSIRTSTRLQVPGAGPQPAGPARQVGGDVRSATGKPHRERLPRRCDRVRCSPPFPIRASGSAPPAVSGCTSTSPIPSTWPVPRGKDSDCGSTGLLVANAPEFARIDAVTPAEGAALLTSRARTSRFRGGTCRRLTAPISGCRPRAGTRQPARRCRRLVRSPRLAGASRASRRDSR